MMDTTCKIKLGSVNNLTDARFGAAMGVQWVGFCFDNNNPLYVSPVQAQAIIGWVAGPDAVAEFSAAQGLNEIEDIIRLLGFEWVQLAEPAMLHYFEGSDINIILEADARDAGFDTLIGKLTNEVKVVLVKNFTLKQVEELLATGKQLLFDVEGLDQNSLEALKNLAPYGINISGGFETAPGIRDFDEMNTVFEMFTVN
jgi:phosphoribosylanthranilate isomerase